MKTLHPKVWGVWIFLETQAAYLSDASRCRFMVACLQLVVMLAMRRTFWNSRSFQSEIWQVVLEAEMEKHGIRKIDLVVWGPE